MLNLRLRMVHRGTSARTFGRAIRAATQRSIAGTPVYLWARVRNNGTSVVQNATVQFYWANPSVGVDRTTATVVGTPFVSLEASETKDVLCLASRVRFVDGENPLQLRELHGADARAPAFSSP